MIPKIPSELIAFSANFTKEKGVCNLELKEEVDAFGNPLETELWRLYTDKETIIKKSAKLKMTSQLLRTTEYQKSPSQFPELYQIS